MKVLIDTNVVLRVAHFGHPHRDLAVQAIEVLGQADEELCLLPQNVYEYWAVVTRPRTANGLGMTIAEAEQGVAALLADFVLLKDERGIFSIWRSLVSTHSVQGKTTHDARLAAAMRKHGVSRLLTFNDADFQRFPGLVVLNPSDVVAGRRV